jgi:hypothetical protein
MSLDAYIDVMKYIFQMFTPIHCDYVQFLVGS